MANEPTSQVVPSTGADKPPEDARIAPSEPSSATMIRWDRRYPPPRTLARWLLVMAAILVVGWLLWNARSALIPFAVGLALAYLLLPIVNALARRLPRPLAILLVYAGGIAVVVGISAYLVPVIIAQVQQLIASLPSANQLQETGRDLLQQYQSQVPLVIRQPIEEGLNNALRTIQTNIATYVQEATRFVWGQVLQVLNVVSFLIGFFIVPIWLFYVLNDQAQGREYIDGMLHPRIRPDFWNTWSIVDNVIGDYMRGQLTLSLIIGVLVGAGMLILQLLGFPINYALLLGVISATTELIPVIGPTLGMIPGIIIGLFISPMTTLAILAVYIIIQQFESSFLVPRIIGTSIGIHPAVLMVVLIMMGYTFGLPGIVLASPAAAAARDLFIYVYNRLGGIPPAEARQVLFDQENMRRQAGQRRPRKA